VSSHILKWRRAFRARGEVALVAAGLAGANIPASREPVDPHTPVPDDWRVLFVNPRWKLGADFPLQADGGAYRFFRAHTPAMGIRFIAENYRDVEILEYPSLDAYERRLAEGIDVVGISFFTYQMDETARMVQLAREYGVKEVWGGGWGIDTPGAKDLFDRSVGGFGEPGLRHMLPTRWRGGLRHPLLYGSAGFFSLRTKIGYLYSIRGCKYKCIYCPTPAVLSDRLIMPLDEIERVLDVYAREKVGGVVIYDETFLSDNPYSWKIVDMLRERGLLWFCMTSAAELSGKVSRLRDTGFVGCLMGIESLRDRTLLEYRRGRLTRLNLKVLDELRDNSCYVVGTYLFCNEEDTVASMRRDIEQLASMEVPSVVPCILTPHAPTPLFTQYRDRILDWDWSHWDDAHLVWRHPAITPADAEEVVTDCIRTCNTLPGNLRIIASAAMRRLIRFKFGTLLRSSSRVLPGDGQVQPAT